MIEENQNVFGIYGMGTMGKNLLLNMIRTFSAEFAGFHCSRIKNIFTLPINW